MKRKGIGARILSIVLLLSIVLGLFPGIAHATEEPMETKAVQNGTVAAKAQELSDKIAALSEGGYWNGKIDLKGFKWTSTNNTEDMLGFRGTFYLVVDHNGTPYLWDGSDTTLTDGKLGSVPMTLSADGYYIASGTTPTNYVNILPYNATNGGRARYRMQQSTLDGVENGASDGTYAPMALATDTTEINIYFFHELNDEYFVIRRGFKVNSTDAKNTEHGIVYDGTGFRWATNLNGLAHFSLYRAWSTVDLRAAIDEVAFLLDDPSAYPEAAYGDFLDCLEASVDLFEAHNGYATEFVDPYDYFCEEVDRQCNALRSHITLLTSTKEYIDVPVEIMDFRCDNLLLQNVSYFNFRYNMDGIHNLPGELLNPDVLTGSLNVRTGLTLQELVDGKLLYQPDTIAYVAEVLHTKSISSRYETAAGHSASINRFVANNIYGKTLGSWEDVQNADGTVTPGTLTKIGGENGGTLLWEDIETAYDLAYYLLTYLWQPVAQGDTYPLSTKTNLADADYLLNSANATYNRIVPERNTLRMYRNDDGLYSIDAGYAVGYSGRYILNSPEADPEIGTGTKGGKDHPYFMPIDGLGFEDDGMIRNNYDTDPAALDSSKDRYDASDSNYHFSMHAYGSFVYYEDQNQKFEFKGDDDVYFFINGKMALDLGAAHSAMTGSLELNDKAEELGLKDGGVYTFDMFYIERAITGSNLRFNTNIKIADTSALTTKGQYLEQSGNQSFVDSQTGMGGEIIDNGLVGIGSTIGYSFDILNTGNAPLCNVSFTDKLLGTDISPDLEEITLFDPDKTNGATTSITDIKVYYRTYDSTTESLFQGSPKKLAYADLMDMVSADINRTGEQEEGKLEPGYYWTTIGSEAQLTEVLTLGIPVDCKFSVYGFKRKTVEEDTPFTNTVISNCYYKQVGSDNLITGSASRVLRVPDASQPPVVERQELVLDYGKSVAIPLDNISERVWFEDGSDATVGTLLGFVSEGYNGQLLKKVPTNLLCVSDRDEADALQGIFTRVGNTIVYRMTEFMEQIETIYAVVELKNFINGSTIYNCVLAEISLIPANMMYYEAEDFANSELHYEKKVSSQVLIQDWTTKTDEDYTEVTEMQDLNLVGQEIHYQDYTNNPDVLFFGFDNTEKDQARYASTGNGYGGDNFDDPDTAAQQWHYFDLKINDMVIDSEEGVMKITSKDAWVGNNHDQNYPDVYVDTISGGDFSSNPLSYKPKNAEVYQIRFKMKNFCIAQDENGKDMEPYINLQYRTKAGTDSGDNSFYIADTWELSYRHFHSYVLDGDQYMVMTLFNSNAFRNSEIINKLRIYFGGLRSISAEKLGEVYIDYVYLGPYDLAPVRETYGWDSSYLRDNYLSNGKSLYVEGNGVRIPSNPNPDKYTEINFSFTGTGFDLITRTGADQGTLRVEVYKDEDRTKAIKTMTVNNKGVLKLYQIPTVSVQDLVHGKYYVSIMVNEENTTAPLEMLRRGNQLYLDAIRIYDPIDVSQGAASTQRDAQIAFAAYCADGEAYPVIKEVREILLTANDFNKLDGESTSGIVYVDYVEEPTETVPATDADGEPTEGTVTVAPDLGIENHVTGVISTYDKVGPKNEVYLSKDQFIAFKLVVYSEQIPSRLDIGCKIIDGNYVRLNAYTAKNNSDFRQSLFLPIHSGTAQYYSLPLWEDRFTEGTDKNGVPMRYIYVAISNFAAANNAENTTGILSITDLKIAYDQEPTLPDGVLKPAAYDLPSAKRTGTQGVELPVDSFVDFVVDGELSEVIDSCINDQYYNTTCDHSGSYWITVREPSVGQEGLCHLRCPMCGEVLETETVAGVSDLTFAGASVSLQSDLAIHYKVEESLFTEMGYSDPYVVVMDNGLETVIRDYTVDDGKLSFVYKNIAPHRMGDTVTATLYANYGDALYASRSRDYSVADYCYNMLGRYGADPKYATLMTLLVDILHYGAESQKYTGYHADSLCTARLTAEQLAMGTELTRELVNHRDQAYEVIENPTVQWKGAGLNLQESVAVRFKLVAESYEGLEVKITLEGRTYTVKAEDFDYREDGTYVHFASLNAAQMSSPIYVAAFRDGVQVSNTICYSIESYAYAKQNDTTIPYLASLVKRMMCYGDSAGAYVGK